ncbi:MAG: site-specific integrase [Oscillospiraceae bacterium]|nr:site-specific integrase [Oscillospiraceae bacterium]
MAQKRTDKDRKVLKKGESQRVDGTYDYRWTTRDGKRHSVYASSLDELRAKEAQIQRDEADGIKTGTSNVTVNDMFKLWCELKRGLKDNTFRNYQYMYNQYVSPDFGRNRLVTVKRSDVKRFYNMLVDGRVLKIATVDTIHTVLHQVFQLAVEDNIIRINPSDGILKELKQSRNFDTEKRRALTTDEQRLFVDFLKNSRMYNHWYPIFMVMLGTGMRVGEVTGLRWCDIDMDKDIINVNQTLVYYKHDDGTCRFSINTPKTKSGRREIPMLEIVKDALMKERAYQYENGIRCNVSVDGYTDFVFVNRFGNLQHQGTLNKAIKRIIRDCNDELFEKDKNPKVLLPRFSCHNLRHTFATKMCECGINIKVIQEILGHSDIETTMDVYAEATKDFKKKELGRMEISNDLWSL